MTSLLIQSTLDRLFLLPEWTPEEVSAVLRIPLQSTTPDNPAFTWAGKSPEGKARLEMLPERWVLTYKPAACLTLPAWEKSGWSILPANPPKRAKAVWKSPATSHEQQWTFTFDPRPRETQCVIEVLAERWMPLEI